MSTMKEHLRKVHERHAEFHLAKAKSYKALGKCFGKMQKAAKSEMDDADEFDGQDIADELESLAEQELGMSEFDISCCKEFDKAASDDLSKTSRGGSNDVPTGDFDAKWLRETAAKHETAARESRGNGDMKGEKIHAQLAIEHRRMADFYESLPDVEIVAPGGSLDSPISWGKAQGMDRFDAIVPDGISGIVGEIPQHIRPVLRAGQREFGKVTDGMDAVLAKTIFGDENE
jgi:hypothetical protein